MSENLEFDRWIAQVAKATITDQDMESLLGMTHYGSYSNRHSQACKRLEVAINSYCHIVRIMREYKDADVDLETSQRLLAKQEKGEPFTDEEIRLLGKRSSNLDANINLSNICCRIKTISDDQCWMLAESLFEQAVVHGTGDITDRARFAAPKNSDELARKLSIAGNISLVTEKHDYALRYSKMSPEKKAEHDQFIESFYRAIELGQMSHNEKDIP